MLAVQPARESATTSDKITGRIISDISAKLVTGIIAFSDTGYQLRGREGPFVKLALVILRHSGPSSL